MDEDKSPAERLCEFLRLAWMDNTPEEARAFWAKRVELFPADARETLSAIDRVIDNPPENLIELMQECGWISLYEETYETVTPLEKDAYVEWLERMRDEFQSIYEQRPSSKL
jgi:hypothetical protein